MNAQPYTCARLTSGQIVPLRKDCECVTHTGPHWLDTDRAWREANRLPANPSMLALHGHAQEEIMRLGELRRAMEREHIAQLLTDEDVTALRASGEAIDLSRPGLRPAVKRLICLSYNDAEAIGPGWRTWAGFVACWEWIAPRMAGRAGKKHDQFWQTYGREAYYARINRVRKGCGFEPFAFAI